MHQVFAAAKRRNSSLLPQSGLDRPRSRAKPAANPQALEGTHETAGRKSSAARSIFPVHRHRPPLPPEQLPEEAKAIWHGIVVGFRADWFQGAEHLLECYCHDVVIGRQIAAELSKCSVDNDRYGDLLRLYLQVVGSMAAIATKLRLTPQTLRDSRNVRHVPPGPHPWENRSDEAESPLAVVPDDSSTDDERNFSFLLQRQRAHRGARATVAATEAADAVSFLGDEEPPNVA
jgi:hypothetical protein